MAKAIGKGPKTRKACKRAGMIWVKGTKKRKGFCRKK